METTLVTGGAGFIGSNIAEALLKDGHRVIVLDDLSSGRKENIAHLLDLDHFNSFREAFWTAGCCALL